MRNKFDYSCSVKICASGFDELLEIIFCILLVVEAFSLQKVVKQLFSCLKSDSQLARDQGIWQMKQNILVHFIQVLKCGCITCGWALSWRRIRPFLLTNAGCRCCNFHCISSICWAYLSDIMVFPGFRKLQWIRQQLITKLTTTFFLV